MGTGSAAQKVASITMAIATMGAAAALASAGQARTRTSFTEAQASRGRDAYRQHCVRCHLADLAGDQLAPPLVGEGFLGRWKGETVGSLFTAIKDAMPPEAPGTATDQEYVDIIAYVASRNGIGPGQQELSKDLKILNTITFEPVER